MAQRIAPSFARPEARRGAREYLCGLLSAVERKNGWQLAEALGKSTPYSVQHLLARAVWDADAVRFQTKPKMARQRLERAFAAGVPCRWVTADSVYGNDRSLQLWLQQQGVAHVLAVTGQEMVTVGWQQYRVKELLPAVPQDAWHLLSAGIGSKGPRLYEWARLPLNQRQGNAWERWLLVRKSRCDPNELTGYIAFAPAGTPMEKRVQVAGARWTIEGCFESAKGEVGLDEYEVRSWHGWHRHITLAMLAHAFLTVLRARNRP